MTSSTHSTDSQSDAPAVQCVVALGASNLTRGFHHVVMASGAVWGSDVAILAALGHGRSYGAPSTFLFRTLPGILDSGLWSELRRRPPTCTRALVTDVGNDIMYGFPVDQIVEWVSKTLDRLRHVTNDIILTDLPIAQIRVLSPAKFLTFRTMLFPMSRLRLATVIERAERLQLGLAEVARSQGVRLSHLNPAWYGTDPIHFRHVYWRSAWNELLGTPTARYDVAWQDALGLYLRRPEHRRVLGARQYTPQHGMPVRSGPRVWLY